MLFGSLVIAAAGWVLMVPLSDIVAGAPVMDIPQFLVAFTLVTIAFPFGRGVCLAMAGAPRLPPRPAASRARPSDTQGHRR